MREPSTASYFRGVFPADRIPSTVGAFIVNTDPQSEAGTHWLAFFIDNEETLEFFDSYGRSPEFFGGRIARFASRFPKVVWNKTRLQSWTSNVCGHYCIYYLLKKCQGFSLDYILCQLSHIKNNDFRMYMFIKKRYGVKTHFIK